MGEPIKTPNIGTKRLSTSLSNHIEMKTENTFVRNNAPVDLSIIIVNWNTGNLLDRCLTSILQHTSGINYEIIVFDNNSGDNSRKVLESYPQVRAIFHHENLGFARANNRAVPHARGEYILFLNPDTELKDNLLPETVEFLKKSPYHVLGVRLRLPDGRIQISSGNFFSLKNMLFQNLFKIALRFRFKKLVRWLSRRTGVPLSQYLNQPDLWDPFRIHSVDWVSGAFYLLRKGDFVAAGGFDEDFVLFAEEVDLSQRLAREGKRAVFYGRKEILHHSGASIKRFQSRSFVLHHLGTLRYYRKHRPLPEYHLYRLLMIFIYGTLYLIHSMRYLVSRSGQKREMKEKLTGYRTLVREFLRPNLEGTSLQLS